MKQVRSACAFAVLVLASRVVMAQGAPQANNAPSVYVELTKAPPKAAARRNPLESDPDSVPAGGKLFAQHCSECHGNSAEGGKKGPSLRADEVQRATPGTIFWLLTNGVVRRGMPVWSKLPEPQRWQLVSYIKSLAPAPQTLPENGKTPHP
jgi:mono/diheme cytochrome c family protein